MNHASLWPTTRRRRWLLGLIILLGTALRLWLWWRTPTHQAANDEVEYLAVARDLLAGRGWHFYDTYHWLRAPLYPLWLAGSLWLVGGELRWAALPNIALSSASIYLFYLLGREIGCAGPLHVPNAEGRPERVGLITACGAALLLTFATFASLWMAETLFTALFVGALIVLLRCAARPRIWLSTSGGVLLGLAILTRSLPLTFLPFVALWLLISGRRTTDDGRRIIDDGRRAMINHHLSSMVRGPWSVAVCFVVATALTIAPWAIRNYLAYGGFIPVETGLSYNLWAFNEPREDEETIFRTLESIRNPVERADYATSKGLARLREDPAILLRKMPDNWNALWRVKPIEDRFLQMTYYRDVPVGLFVTALVLDDALYAVIAVAGLIGVLLAPLDRRKTLLGGWLLYVILIVLLTHGEGRYRHFIFPTLLPYAAWLIVAPGERRSHGFRRPALAVAAALGVLALLAVPLIQQYPWAWASRNVRRGWAVQRAEWSAQANDRQGTIAAYQQAATIDPDSPDVWLGLGRYYQQRGDDQAALAAFEKAYLRARLYIAANARRADALRRLGQIDQARRAFRGFHMNEVEMMEWSWANLDTPPPSLINVGDGLDFGFVQGMYAAERHDERRARWTGARAELKLAGSSTGGVLRLILAAPRPDTQHVPLSVCINQQCQAINLDAQWRTYALAAPPASEYRVVLTAPVFTPQQFDPQSRDDRQLGVLIDRAVIEPFTSAH